MKPIAIIRAAMVVTLAGMAPVRPVAGQPANLLAETAKAERLLLEVERTEDLREIRRLQYAHAHLLLYAMWDEIADLYCSDAEVISGDGTIRGRDAIRSWLIERYGGEAGPERKVLHAQLLLAPVVTLSADGHSAKGRWLELAMTGTFGQHADWFGGTQVNEYVKEDGVWKIFRLHNYPQFAGPYESGWLSLTPDLPVVPYHFIPSQAGRPVPEIPGSIERPEIKTEAELSEGLSESERRIARLNDEDTVRNLQNAYGYYIDRKMWDDAVDLFTEDATFAIGSVGEYRGKAGVRRALELDGPAELRYGQVNDRLQLHTIVTVQPDGREARVRGLQFSMLTPKLGEAYWEIATFENTYLKAADGKWRIHRVGLSPIVRSDYYQGWAKSWTDLPAPPLQLAPDRAARNRQVGVPAFSYMHPVTGRPIGGQTVAPQPPETETQAPSGPIEARLAAAVVALDRAKAYDAIENVSSALGHYLDDFQWEAFADSYSVDGWKPRAGGYYVGRDRIYRSMVQAYMAGPSPTMVRDTIRAHVRTQPVIDVSPDAKAAKIRTRLFLYTISSTEPGSFANGVYPNDAAVLEDGVWKLSVGGAIDEKYFQSTNWKDGWARPRPASSPPTVRPTPSSPPAGSLGRRLGNPVDIPPDVPASTMPARLRGFVRGSPIWPEIKPMWFAYPNPVSGRLPENYCPDLKTCELMAAAAEARRLVGK